MPGRRTMLTISVRLLAGVQALPAALALVSVSALSAFAATPASATVPTPVGFTLLSAGMADSVSLHGLPGQVLGGAVLVRNASKRSITVSPQRADIRNASNGNADYVTTRTSGTGRWLHLDTQRIRLACGVSGVLLIALPAAVWKLARRPITRVAQVP
jgi:hypothetical protein